MAQNRTSADEVGGTKTASARMPDDEVPALEKTTKLNPFAGVRERGGLCNIAKSAVRALDILEIVAHAAQPPRAVEITRALSLSPSSANQVLKTMVDSGYLIFDATTKSYDLSPRLMHLGTALSARYFGPDSIDRLMHAVKCACEGNVMLAASQGAFMQVLDICDLHAQDAPRDFERSMLGAQVPIFGTCTGAAWLSSQKDETILKTIQKCRRDLGKRASDIDGIMESIRRVRRQGYAFGGLMADDGVWSVAVALPPTANGTVLVLAVAGPERVIDGKKAEIAALIREQIRIHLGSAAEASLP